MINVKGNLFDQQGWLCITTNGFVKNNGRAVMGAGCAKTLRDAIPDADLCLGRKLKANGNIVQCIAKYQGNLVLSFPVKHNWWEDADLDLIAKSARALRDAYLERLPNVDVWIPRPGCGNGRLSYTEVEPVLASILVEDCFKIITF